MHFDYLRLLLASLVMFSHCFSLVGQADPLQRVTPFASLASSALYGFFLLSGYLITQSWLSDPSVGRYLVRRVLRLYPAFIVASIVSVFIAGPIGADPAQYFHDLEIGRFFRGLLLLHDPQTPPVFAGSIIGTVNGAMWTISFEFRCYLLVLVFALLRVYRSRLVLLGLTALVVSYACMTTPLPGPTDSQHLLFGLKALRISDSMLWFAALFMTGSCFYVWRDRIVYTRTGCVIALVLLCASVFSLDTIRAGYVFGLSYLIFGLASSPLLANRSERPVDRSYGLYLYAWPVTKIISWYVPGINVWWLFATTACAAYVLATLSWKIVEAPALRLKPGRRDLRAKGLHVQPT